MAKSVQYNGPTERMGRFGVVRKGDILEMEPVEYLAVRDDKNFLFLEPIPQPEEGAEWPAPGGSSSYDLRNENWSHPQISVRLRKKGKSTLNKIANAITEQTGLHPNHGQHYTRKEIASSIYECVLILDWVKKPEQIEV